MEVEIGQNKFVPLFERSGFIPNRQSCPSLPLCTVGNLHSVPTPSISQLYPTSVHDPRPLRPGVGRSFMERKGKHLPRPRTRRSNGTSNVYYTNFVFIPSREVRKWFIRSTVCDSFSDPCIDTSFFGTEVPRTFGHTFLSITRSVYSFYNSYDNHY